MLQSGMYLFIRCVSGPGLAWSQDLCVIGLDVDGSHEIFDGLGWVIPEYLKGSVVAQARHAPGISSKPPLIPASCLLQVVHVRHPVGILNTLGGHAIIVLFAHAENINLREDAVVRV